MRPWKISAGILLLAVLGGQPAWSVEPVAEEEAPKLLGRCTPQQLGEEPYADWFRAGYEGYEPNAEIVERLDKADLKGVELTVFFGTWCGDSQREVPRLLKLLERMKFPAARTTLVALNDADDAIKTSPTGEEKGVEVYRIPTIVVSRDGREVARLVEHPVLSLERDLLAIVSGEPYEPDYTTYPIVRRWLREGLLSDENVSPRGLAGQVRHEVPTEGELASAARVLLSRGQTREAVKLYRVNCDLYPDSSPSFARLAEALLAQGELGEAHEAAEKALRLNRAPDRVEDLIKLLESTQE